MSPRAPKCQHQRPRMASPSSRNLPHRPPPTTLRSRNWRAAQEGHCQKVQRPTESPSPFRTSKRQESMVKSGRSGETHRMNSRMPCRARHRLRCLARAGLCRWRATARAMLNAPASQASWAVGPDIPISSPLMVLDFLTDLCPQAATTEDPPVRDVKIWRL